MCLREEENGTNWSQCCICVCEACLLHNLISYSYNSHSHAVISPGYHINKYVYCRGSQSQSQYISIYMNLRILTKDGYCSLARLVWWWLFLIITNFSMIYCRSAKEERPAWEEHPECGAWPVIWEDKIRKSWHHITGWLDIITRDSTSS